MSLDISMIRTLADHYGFTVAELTKAADVVGLEEKEFVVRFTELVSFASAFGVDPLDLARLVEGGSGVQPWRRPPRDPSP